MRGDVMNLSDSHIVAYCSADIWTKWLPLKEFNKVYPTLTANYRNRYLNEAILETDFPEKETNFRTISHACKILADKGIFYSLWFSGNKSFHIHVLFDHDLTKPMIRAWVYSIFAKSLADSFDDVNWSEKRLIGIENETHRKTGVKKTLVESFESERVNVFPQKIIQDALAEEEKRKQFENLPKKKFSGTCAVSDTALEFKFDEGQNRHQHLVPNLVAYHPKELWQQLADVQGKKLSEFEGWGKTDFNCVQLQKFAKRNGVEGMCAVCPNRIVKLSSIEKNDLWLFRKTRGVTK